MARDDPDLFEEEDAAIVERVARDMLDRHGDGAIAYLRDRAIEASGIGDAPSERAWLDIAERAAELIFEDAVTSRPGSLFHPRGRYREH